MKTEETMHSAIHKFMFPLLAAILLFQAAGCEEEQKGGGRFRQTKGTALGQPSPEAREKLQRKGAGLVAKVDGDKLSSEAAIPSISETDFIESLDKRDPFRPFVEVLIRGTNTVRVVQREIKLEEYDISQLKLVAIITNIGDPRAMVVTPENVGIVLRRGDYVGKADFVDSGTGAEKIQINWKVHRINAAGREEERGIFLVRDDPLTPAEDDVTRFMPLYPSK
jgi:hypothetical protein